MCRIASRLVLLLAVGLALGACSKCDIPTWPQPEPSLPQKALALLSTLMPQSCHDERPQ
jgi:hypothetical protein